MQVIPRDPGFDQTLEFLDEPYEFISRHCQRARSDVIEVRLALRRTVCMTGHEAARLFYDESRLQRHGAAMLRLQRSLFGRHGVQTLDGGKHRERKAMLLELLSPERVRALVSVAERHWALAIERWSERAQVTLYDEMQKLLTGAVCEWAGLPLRPEEVPPRTRELALMFDRAGAIGPPHWRARIARNRAEHWIRSRLRGERRQPGEDRECALATIAHHRDSRGRPLPAQVAAAELLNVLRPTVAVSVFVVFAALALRTYPNMRARLLRGDEALLDAFVQEVRRFYPFFPAAVARVRETFVWHDYEFPRGRRVLLDLHGINHDGRLWRSPDIFRPERFFAGSPDSFTFVPQGGATADQQHRCPGEGVTVELMKQAVRALLHRLRYVVPPQDLSIDRSRLPALPHSRFVIADVRHARNP